VHSNYFLPPSRSHKREIFPCTDIFQELAFDFGVFVLIEQLIDVAQQVFKQLAHLLFKVNLLPRGYVCHVLGYSGLGFRVQDKP
jgi:hypothetical protein